DYIRDLVRRDQEYEIKRDRLHAAIEEGRASGISDRSVEDIIADAKKHIKKEANAKRKDAA
ncbi:MAG: type II toxin-antitoxin system ParD family antitoxin, partial [Parasphingorhabdus sp.]